MEMSEIDKYFKIEYIHFLKFKSSVYTPFNSVYTLALQL